MINIITLFLAMLAVGSCDKDTVEPTPKKSLELSVNLNNTKQTIHSFGASDAWSCQFVGNWTENKKEKMADWLFSQEFDENGNPLGIGLSCWRFNIGGGSAEQGSSSGINDEWRRAESFMTGEDHYNWSSLEGQRWFLRSAKEHGVEQFIGFVNSPPVQLTRNGKAYTSNQFQYNLAPDKYDIFSNYLADVVTNIAKNEGVYFDYISPVNEPQWDWNNGGQEGSPAQNSEVAELCRAIDKVFNEKGITSKIELPESGQLNYLYENGNRPGRGEQIKEFFDPASKNYVGDLKSVAKKIAGHSYYTTWPIDKQIEVRNYVHESIEALPEPIEFWMTEYCLLEDNSEVKGNGRDLTMEPALYVARLIFSDLVLANASSWQWWIAISPYNYKDGLVYTDLNKRDGNYYDSKILWALGNFSRFVRPGMKRVEITRNDGRSNEQTLDNIMATAFVSDDQSQTTVVIVNQLKIDMPLSLKIADQELTGDFKIYVTNNENNLSYQGDFASTETYVVPAGSVVTITNL